MGKRKPGGAAATKDWTAITRDPLPAYYLALAERVKATLGAQPAATTT